jgi:protein involved in polysaccharide export with SLBB domain
MRRHVVAVLVTILAIASFIGGCASSSSTAPGASAFVVPVAPVPDDQYVIQRRDTLSVTFATHPDHDQLNLLVRDDGKITMPLVGDVQAAGLTPPQLVDRLVELYSHNLRNPSIAVNVQELEQELVWVGGAVREPGTFRYKPGLTATQALVGVGGPSDAADLHECVLLQKAGADSYRASKIDLAKVIENGDTKADPVLGPRDVLVVPMSGIAKANVFMKQYILNMIPIRFSYKTPHPATGSNDETTASESSGTSSSASRSTGASRPSGTGASSGSGSSETN